MQAIKCIILSLFFSHFPGYAQYIVTTSVDNAGNTYWSPTAGAPKTSVRGLPTIPTLVYNCILVPSLCNNIAQLQPNAPAGNSIGTFGWDPNVKRKKTRRRTRCPENWKRTPKGARRCPQSNQPEIHPLGATDIVPPEVDENDLSIYKTGSNGKFAQTGIKMSCDEFPPAMSIQGGLGPKGGPGNGVTYCAPSKSNSSATVSIDHSPISSQLKLLA